MTSVKVVSRIAEHAREMTDQSLTHGVHFGGAAALCSKRGLSLAPWTAVSKANEIHRRSDIEEQTVIGDSRFQRGAHRCEPPEPARNASTVFTRPGGNAKLGAQIDHRFDQASDVFGRPYPQPIERHHRIDRQLAGAMDKGPSAAIDPAEFQLPRDEVSLIETHVCSASFTTNRHERRVLADQQRARLVISTADLVNEPLLQKERGVVIDGSQEVNFQGIGIR